MIKAEKQKVISNVVLKKTIEEIEVLAVTPVRLNVPCNFQVELKSEIVESLSLA